MTNARFAEYVTSGAFSLSLTRSQISSLALLAGGGSGGYAPESLARKGLAEPINSSLSEDRVDWRVTGAGALCLSLLFEAGLTNSGKNAAAAEIDAMRAELDKANQTVRDVRKKTWAMYARLQEVEAKNAELEKQLAQREREDRGIRLRPEFVGDNTDFVLRARDPMPEVPTEELLK